MLRMLLAEQNLWPTGKIKVSICDHCFGQCQINDVALRVTAAKRIGDGTTTQQQFGGMRMITAPERHGGDRNASRRAEAGFS